MRAVDGGQGYSGGCRVQHWFTLNAYITIATVLTAHENCCFGLDYTIGALWKVCHTLMLLFIIVIV